MGWSTGSEICEEVCKIVKEYVKEDDYEKVSADICKLFVDRDGDDFDFYPGTPYWNYLKKYAQDYFLAYLKESVEEKNHTYEEIKEWLKDFKYEGFNVILIKWLEEDVRGHISEEERDYIFDIVLDAERQAEIDEDNLWNTEF